ncbi:MAG TPA: hypothetical protein VMI06_08665 [Terriglobia bacterium]|nr:hypothetical protein [Terriglobia bacterium]
MTGGRVLAVSLGLATVAFVVIGTLWPVPSAAAYAGGQRLLPSSSTPEAAVTNLGDDIRLSDWNKAYSSLANKNDFSEFEFVHDLTGYYPCLRTYASLESFSVRPLHASAQDADMRFIMNWSTVVGTSTSSRDLHVVAVGDQWKVDWPIHKEPVVRPQVVSEDYLRWDVIFRGPGDDWGAQDVDSPHVTIIDMHPVQRAEGVVVLGELLNADVVPAYVSITATLQSKDQAPIATESAFDMISHLLLPKQVTPFLINFPGQSLANIGSIRMAPFSALVSAAAGPVIEIDNEHLNPTPNPSLTGALVNQSGKPVSVAHVLGTLYDQSGQVVWVVDRYMGRALLPQTPASFDIPIPEDLAGKVSSQRTVVSSFSFGGLE